MTYEYRPPSTEDILSVASRMRDCDVLEVAASSNNTPLQALVDSVRGPGEAFCFAADDVAQCIFGYRQDVAGNAVVWLLCADSVRDHAQYLTKETKRITDAWLDASPILYNWVAEDNHRTMRWLKLIGFEAHPAGTFTGDDGITEFVLMEKRRV